MSSPEGSGSRRATEVRQAQSLHRHHVSADLGTSGLEVGGLEFGTVEALIIRIGFWGFLIIRIV